MKRLLLNGVALFLAISFIGSCNKIEEFDSTINLDNDGKTLVANIVEPTSGDIGTRTSISSSFRFSWAEGDILGIYPDEGDQIYFKITDGIGSNTATFNGGGWALKKGYTYYSYYPFSRDNFSSEDTKEAIPVSIDGQSIDGSDMFGHLGKYDPMFAQSENSTGSIAWDFQHLVSWLKLKVTLPVNCNISKIVLSNADGLLHTKGTVDITAPSPAITTTNNLQEISIPCKNLAVKANEETVIPIAIIPTNLTGKTITIKLFTDFLDYSFNISVTKEWKQGYFYSQVIIDTNEIPTYTVTTPGTLSSLVGDTNKYRIESMKVVGNLNGTDIRFIRDMAGRSYSSAVSTNGILKELDLSDANIVEGGDYYYYTSTKKYYTENNVIGDYMFEYCKLTSIVLPSNVTSIGAHAFSDCDYLSGVSIPNTVQVIGIAAFSSCNILTRITVPNSVTLIKSGAFNYCFNLSNITLSNNLETIEGGNFDGSSIKNIVIPNSVTTIGKAVLARSNELESVTISENIKEIGDEFCFGGFAIKEVICYAKTPPTLGKLAFKSNYESYPVQQPKEKIDVLYVPRGCSSAYSESDWNKYFIQIIEME